MIRILEILISLLIVAVLAAVVGVLLPRHGHIERRVEVSSPVRQIFDSVDTFRRYPQWSGLRGFDPAVRMTLEGPESGPGARVTWSSSQPKIGNGSLEIVSDEQDQQVRIKVDNNWVGTNKFYTITLVPSPNGKTTSIRVAYDVDYGWNLLWRYAGLYINGTPAAVIQGSLNGLAALLAGFPNTDYSDQDIRVVEVAAKPIFLVNTKAPRTLADVQDATYAALEQIGDAIEKAGLKPDGPIMTITTNWGDEDYSFAVAVPVNATSFTENGKTYTIQPPVKRGLATDAGEATPSEAGTADEGDEGEEGAAQGDADKAGEATGPQPGSLDDEGMLVVDAHVRATMWYAGKALVSDYTGSAAALPLLRLNLRAYAETHGYHYNQDATLGRFWDEMVSSPDVAEDAHEYKVYLPFQL